MWYVAYNILLALAAPVILLVLLVKKRCRRGLPQRLGIRLPAETEGPGSDERRVVWVHAVSLGEVVAVAPLIRELQRLYPDCRFLVTTVTETGREAVEQRLSGVAIHHYAPLDFPWTVERVVRRFKPAAYLLVEAELWPNLLRALARRGVPNILINGRLSSRSYRRYHLINPFMRRLLGTLSACLMQSDRDAQRMIALGAEPSRVFRTGNIKFDQPLPGPEMSDHLTRRSLGLAEHEELFVAGSSHPGEEEQLLECFLRLSEEFPSLVLLLAPRHVERSGQLEMTIDRYGLPAVRRTSLRGQGASGGAGTPRVIVLDTRGELATVYRHAVAAFVGGTLVPVGGHNLLEPAAWGKPVFFGPYTDHCAEIARLLLQGGGGISVPDGGALHAALRRYLKDRRALEQMGQDARRTVEENQGAIAGTLAHVTKILDPLLRRERQATGCA